MAICKQIWCPENAVQIQTQIRSKTYHTNLRAKRTVVDNLIALFFLKGKGKAKLMEDGAQEKLYEYKFKFASKPCHANLRTKQIVIDIIDIMRLFENWGSKFFGRC